MLAKKQIQRQIAYWHQSSQEKLKTMQALYRNRRYADCLFFGHLILEQALKANVVNEQKIIPPRTHNLVHLARLSNLVLKENDLKLLADTDAFNMKARYPDEKLEFYKRCNKPYTDLYYQPIIILYKELCRRVK